MKKFVLFLILSITMMTTVFAENQKRAFCNMVNPWTDCEADFACANKVSGLEFPMRLSNYWIRAMENMIEISYPLDEFRHVSVRKSMRIFDKDISGVYTKYPVNKTIYYDKDIPVKIRGKRNKIYVMHLSKGVFRYSAYCEQGMSRKEAKGVYQNIQETDGF